MPLLKLSFPLHNLCQGEFSDQDKIGQSVYQPQHQLIAKIYKLQYLLHLHGLLPHYPYQCLHHLLIVHTVQVFTVFSSYSVSTVQPTHSSTSLSTSSISLCVASPPAPPPPSSPSSSCSSAVSVLMLFLTYSYSPGC